MTPQLKNKSVQKRRTAQIVELKNALAYARAIVNTVREPLVVLYPKLTISSVNKAFYNIFKTDIKDTVGKHLYEIGNGQFDIPLLKKLLEETLSKRNTLNDFEIENNFEAIGHKIMLLNARKLNITGNDDQMILLAIEDITGRRSLEKNVQEAKNTVIEQKHLLALAQQKVDFVTITSHDLKTPITCIKAYTQLLETELATQDTNTKVLLTKMQGQIEKLTHLLNNLLETTKIESGKLYTISPTLK
ncbi:MAG: histidine kinase dimerization/phospho-acceptor domain-containing protein [Ginsengibacter sp.]